VPVGHPTIPEMMTCLTGGACDMGFMGPDPSRTGVEFSPPILQLDYTFLVPAGSSIQRITDVDRPGVRIAVVSDHASTLTLSRILKHAQLVYAATPDPTFELLRSGQADAFASVRRLARIQAGIPKDELKIHLILLDADQLSRQSQALGLSQLWDISRHLH